MAACLVLTIPGCAGGGGGAAKASPKDAGFDVAGDRPASPKTLYTMARLLVNQHREAEAERLLIEAAAAEPAYLPAFVALAELQLKIGGRADAALATLDKALVKAPRDATLHNNRGMCLVAKKEYDGAYEAFTRAVELDAGTARFRANRAMALGLLGKYEQCLAAYTTVVSPAEAHHNLAVLCRIRGDEVRAKMEFSVAESLRNPAAPQERATRTEPEPRG
jgi:tetratricopeptide (TPR) repeat protein